MGYGDIKLLGNTMEGKEASLFYRTPSIDKRKYTPLDPGASFRNMTPREAAVYNGNFSTQFLSDIYGKTAPRLAKGIAGVAQLAGEIIKERKIQPKKEFETTQFAMAETLEAAGIDYEEYAVQRKERSDIFAEKLINFGLHMTDVANEKTELWYEEHPVTMKSVQFMADVTSSLLVSIALASVGGPGFAGVVLGAESGLGIAVDAFEAEGDLNKALIYGAFTGIAVSKLEKFGLKKVFGNTMGRGLGVVSRYISEAITAEASTEALQTMVELGAGIATGAQKELTIHSFLSQVIYAAAVGAVAGGGMVAAVAIPQRRRAIQTTQEVLGLDRGTSTRLVNTGMQYAQATVLEDMGNEHGFGHVTNKYYQNLRDTTNNIRGILTEEDKKRGVTLRDVYDIATGEGTTSREQFESAIKGMIGEQKINETMAKIRASVGATIQAQIEAGEIKGKRIKGEKEAVKAQEALLAEEEKKEIELPGFEEIVDDIDIELGREYKAAVKGRLDWIKRRLKVLDRELIKTIGAKESARTMQWIDKNMDEHSNLINEYDAIMRNPNSLEFEKGKEVKVSTKILQTLALRKVKAVLAQARKNFKRGKRAVKEEIRYIKKVINTLANQPGIKLKQRQQLKGIFSTIQTERQLQDRIYEIEQTVQQMIDDNYIFAFQTSIRSIEVLMKGTPKKKNFPAEQQALADIYLRAKKEVDIDPGKEMEKMYTAKGYMRTLAAQLAKDRNLNGEELNAQDYANIESALRRFAKTGTLQFVQQQKIKKETFKKMNEKVAQELKEGKVIRSTEVAKILENILMSFTRQTNLGVMTGALLKGLANESGSSLFAEIMDVFPAIRIAEINWAYFNSKFEDGGKRIFNLESRKVLNEKLITDKANQIQIFNEKGKLVYENSIANTREKYMLWLSPDGKNILKNKYKWDESLTSQIRTELGAENIAFIELQLEIYSEMYDEVNKIFRKLNGYDLPRREFYSPLFREGYDLDNDKIISFLIGKTEIDLHTGKPKFIKPRTQDVTKDLMDIADDQKMNMYINDMSYYIGTAETIERLQVMLKDNGIKKQIIESKNEQYYDTLRRYMDVITENSAYDKKSKLFKGWSKAVTNFNKSVLVAKPVLFAKQLSSSFAAMDVVRADNYFRYMSEIPAAFKSGEIMKMLSHPFFPTRGKRMTITRDLAEIAETLERDLPREKKVKKAIWTMKLNHYLFLMTRLGDATGLIVNGWAVYRHNIEQEKMSSEEALAKAVRHINNTQQSRDHATMTPFALNSDPLSRSITAFTHAPMQYVSKLVEQLNTIGTDKFETKTFARTYAIYALVLPMLFSAIGRGFRRRKEDTPEYMAEAVLGPFDRLPLLGPLLKWGVSTATYRILGAVTEDEAFKRPYARLSNLGVIGSMFNNVQYVERELTKILTNEELTASDLYGLTTKLSETLGPIGGMYAGMGRTVSNAAQGISFMVEENGNGSFVNSWRRLLMLLGYSAYATKPIEE